MTLLCGIPVPVHIPHRIPRHYYIELLFELLDDKPALWYLHPVMRCEVLPRGWDSLLKALSRVLENSARWGSRKEPLSSFRQGGGGGEGGRLRFEN